MGREVLKEEIDYTIFADEPQFYLAQIRGGCPGGEDEAFALTVHNYAGRVTADDVRSWARDPTFQRALKHAREMGDENREYDAQIAARRSVDPFGIPPRGGMDLAAETYDLQSPPRTGMGGWLRRLKQAWLAQPAEEPATSSGQRFVAGDDLTPQQLQAIRFQEAAQRQPEPSRSIFSQTPNPDSFPAPE